MGRLSWPRSFVIYVFIDIFIQVDVVKRHMTVLRLLHALNFKGFL